MTRRRCLLGLAVFAGLTVTDAVAQNPGYFGPQMGGYNNGYGGYGYDGGYGGYPSGGYGGGSYGGGVGGFGGASGPYAPNFYNRQTQPLSPYLNLFRNNPAVNYFYGVRPGLPSGQPIGQAFNSSIVGPAQLRAGFVPFIAGNPSDEPQEIPAVGPSVRMPSEAHAVIYGSRFGPLAGGSFGRPNRSGYGGNMGGGNVGGGYGGGGMGGMNRNFNQQPMNTGQGMNQGFGTGSRPILPIR